MKRVTRRQAERVLRLCKNPEITLKMDWAWSGTPTPTLLTEGVCDAIALCEKLQPLIDAAGIPVWAEPYACYALSLYRRDQ
jgi:hypothetical protein